MSSRGVRGVAANHWSAHTSAYEGDSALVRGALFHLRYAAQVSGARHDVAIIGAGMAGLSASVLLRHAGLRVVCLDWRRYPQRKVGESLDWSSPGLLRRVGIDTYALLTDRIATYKKKIPSPGTASRRVSATPDTQPTRSWRLEVAIASPGIDAAGTRSTSFVSATQSMPTSNR